MTKKNKTHLILSSLVVLLPAFVGLLLWDTLPEQMTTHWNAGGEADGWSGKAFTVFGLPLIMLAIHLFCVVVTLRDTQNKEQSSKVVGMIFWLLPMVSLICCGMVYVVALGSGNIVDVAVRILLGLMFMVMGNYMPKCKQNHTIGVKVSWALRNEENWNQTHRFTGRLWVLGGVLILATLFIPMENMMYGFLAVIMVMSFVPMLYSYLYYRKQLKAGTASKENMVASSTEKKATVISMVIGLVILALAGVLMVAGDIDVCYGGDTFTIEMDFWDDSTVSYGEIDSVEYREQDDPGERTYGFGSFKLLAGKFNNDEFGDYTRYSYANCKACVVIKSGERVLVVNGRDEESTRAIYEELNQRMNK